MTVSKVSGSQWWSSEVLLRSLVTFLTRLPPRLVSLDHMHICLSLHVRRSRFLRAFIITFRPYGAVSFYSRDFSQSIPLRSPAFRSNASFQMSSLTQHEYERPLAYDLRIRALLIERKKKRNVLTRRNLSKEIN